MRRIVALLATAMAFATACSSEDVTFNDILPQQTASAASAAPSTQEVAKPPHRSRVHRVTASQTPQSAEPTPTSSYVPPPPAPNPAPNSAGTSDVTMAGAFKVHVSHDFRCLAAKDDYFIRQTFDLPNGMMLAVSINVEFYDGPGDYSKRVQILIRKLRGTTYYASWYQDLGTMTVLPGNRGADMPAQPVPAEPHTQGHGTLHVDGHFGCMSGEQ